MPLLAPEAAEDAAATIDLSVVILNWNARDYLRVALQSLVGQNWRHAIEIIVVDNASQLDNSAAMVRAEFPQVQLIESPVNLGFSAGNNLGYAATHGRFVLFLNPDTIVHDGALDILIEWMDAHPEVGACGPKLLNSDGSLQASCRAFPSLGAGFFRNTPLGRLWPNNPWTRAYLMQGFTHDREANVDWLSGSALMARRAALEQIVPPVPSRAATVSSLKASKYLQVWDESFFMYCEDVDLCYRLKQAGWQRWYLPHATITHRIGASSDWAQGAMIRQHHGSMLRFFFKHYTRGWGILLAPIALLGVGLRVLGAVVKLYWRYFQCGEFGRMLRHKFNRRSN